MINKVDSVQDKAYNRASEYKNTHFRRQVSPFWCFFHQNLPKLELNVAFCGVKMMFSAIVTTGFC